MTVLICWFKNVFMNNFEMAQLQVLVHRLYTLGALMGTVSTPRGVMDTLTAQMAVMKWLVEVSCIQLALPCSTNQKFSSLNSI